MVKYTSPLLLALAQVSIHFAWYGKEVGHEMMLPIGPLYDHMTAFRRTVTLALRPKAVLKHKPSKGLAKVYEPSITF